MPIFDDTRADWKARSPRGRITTVPPSRRVGCMWHWNGPAMRLAGRPHSACLAAVLADQRFHQGTRGWSDVGYTGLICPHGRAIEGRGVDTVGAHCAGYNTDWYGFQCMLGEGETVTAAQWARAAELIRDVTARSGHALRHLPHSAGFATSCPGPEITRWTKSPNIAASVGGSTTSPTSGGPSGGATFEEDDVSWNDQLPVLGSEKKQSAGYQLTAANVHSYRADKKLDQVLTQLEAMTAVMETLASNQGADPAEIAGIVDRAVRDRLATLTLPADEEVAQ
jgi:hypothetical protein